MSYEKFLQGDWVHEIRLGGIAFEEKKWKGK